MNANSFIIILCSFFVFQRANGNCDSLDYYEKAYKYILQDTSQFKLRATKHLELTKHNTQVSNTVFKIMQIDFARTSLMYERNLTDLRTISLTVDSLIESDTVDFGDTISCEQMNLLNIDSYELKYKIYFSHLENNKLEAKIVYVPFVYNNFKETIWNTTNVLEYRFYFDIKKNIVKVFDTLVIQ